MVRVAMAEVFDPLDGCESRCRLRLLWRTAAASGQPDRLRCDVRPLLTWPLPVQPGVGHLTIVSCIASTAFQSLILDVFRRCAKMPPRHERAPSDFFVETFRRGSN